MVATLGDYLRKTKSSVVNSLVSQVCNILARDPPLTEATVWAGYSQFKQLFFITLPAIVVVHLVSVAVVTHSYAEPMWSYLRRGFPRRLNSMSAQLLSCTLRMTCILAVCGVGLMLMNGLTEYQYKCTDPLLALTTATAKPTRVYQWSWVLLSCLVMVFNARY